jgi:lipopolysaccharide biosynthesis protein
MSKNNKYHSRKFLNKKQGMAAIECIGSLTDYSLDIDINISDCSRKVSLDFYAMNPKDAKEKLNKLDLLLSEIAAARVYYADNISAFEELYNNKRKEIKLRKNRNTEKYNDATASLHELLADD